MRRFVHATTLAAALLLAAAATAHAQARFFVGAGASIPVSEYGDLADTGWITSLGVVGDLGDQGVFGFFEGMYGRNSHSGVTGNATNLYGGGGALGYRFGDASKAGVYVYGSAGLLVNKFSPNVGSGTSKTRFAFGPAFGIDIPLNKVALWIEGRYIHSKDTRFIPIMVGLSFGGGN